MCTLVLMEMDRGTTISSVLRVSVEAVLDQLMEESAPVLRDRCRHELLDPPRKSDLVPDHSVNYCRRAGLDDLGRSAHALCLPQMGDTLNRNASPTLDSPARFGPPIARRTKRPPGSIIVPRHLCGRSKRRPPRFTPASGGDL